LDQVGTAPTEIAPGTDLILQVAVAWRDCAVGGG